MGINIELRSESGEVLARIADPKGLVAKVLAGADWTRLLRYIDPYGDTMFNRQQAALLVQELGEVQRQADPEAAAILGCVATLAQRVEAEPHLYLWFLGD